MKTLKFSSHLVDPVLSEEKDSTWRLFDDKDLREGDELSLVERNTDREFAKAVITSIREKKLKDLVESDFSGHEKYESEEKMYETYRGYYGDRVIPDSVIKIIKFHLIK
jgi:hypothetical protein